MPTKEAATARLPPERGPLPERFTFLRWLGSVKPLDKELPPLRLHLDPVILAQLEKPFVGHEVREYVTV